MRLLLLLLVLLLLLLLLLPLLLLLLHALRRLSSAGDRVRLGRLSFVFLRLLSPGWTGESALRGGGEGARACLHVLAEGDRSPGID